MRITVILPFLNEAPLLDSCLRHVEKGMGIDGEWEVLLSDSGSGDGSGDVARKWATRPGTSYVPWERNDPPSVGKAVEQAVRQARGEIVWVLPVDCPAPPAAWAELKAAVDRGYRCGAFPKVYSPASGLLTAYARAQNRIRLRGLRHAVWTNGMFFPTNESVPTGGFLEDVQLSDRLRRRNDWTCLSTPLEVSSRRYYPDRTLGRIALNAGILLAYRLLRVPPRNLHRWYRFLK